MEKNRFDCGVFHIKLVQGDKTDFTQVRVRKLCHK